MDPILIVLINVLLLGGGFGYSCHVLWRRDRDRRPILPIVLIVYLLVGRA